MAQVFKMKEMKKVRKQPIKGRARTRGQVKALKRSEKEHKQAEEIKERKQRFAEVADLLPQTLLECDRNGRITFIDPGFLRNIPKGLDVNL